MESIPLPFLAQELLVNAIFVDSASVCLQPLKGCFNMETRHPVTLTSGEEHGIDIAPTTTFVKDGAVYLHVQHCAAESS